MVADRELRRRPADPLDPEAERGNKSRTITTAYGLFKRMKMPADIRSLCRAYTPETVRIVAGIVRSETTRDSDKLTGIAMLWDRGWGKAPQAHTGENGEGDIRVIVRHILDTRDKPAAQAHLASEVSVLPLTINHRDGDRDG